MNKKNIQAFTLMELLAVLVILAIIALIVFPIIGDVITDSKKKAFKSSVDGLAHAVSLDYQKDYYTGVREYMYSGGELTLLTVKDEQKMNNIKVEGIIEDGIGFISVDKDGNTSLAIHNGEWCATKEVSDQTITIEEKTNDNCNVETPDYCFGVKETNLASYDINLENCIAYLNEGHGYDKESEEEAIKFCTKGILANNEGGSIEIVIDQGWIDIEKLVETKVIENIVYRDGLVISDYKCYEGNSYGYKTITDVIIPSKINNKPIFRIGRYSLSQYDLTSVIIPGNIKEIQPIAFANNKLMYLSIPNGVEIIGECAFADNQLKSLIIPNSVTTIGKGAFHYNQLPDDQAFIYARKKDGSVDKTTIISYGGSNRDNVIIPGDVQTIGEYAFYDLNLTNVTLGNNVQIIGDSAFYRNNLTNIIIPDSVNTIGEYAFESNKLTSITLGNNIKTIGICAFNNNQLSDDQAFIYARKKDGSVDKTTIISYGGSNRDNVIIPGDVQTIGEYAFYNLNLTNVTLGNNVQIIGDSAFYSNNLTNIIIPASVTTTGEYSFASNTLTSVMMYPGITSIKEGTFQWNDLTNVVIPDSVKTIGEDAFYDNDLTSVTIPNGVETIGKSAFYSNNLTNITIPNSVTIIEDYAFANNKLSSVILGTGVTSIGYNAFRKYRSHNPLTTIVNQTGREFDWQSITDGSSTATFVTGTIPHKNGDITVTDK